MESKAVEASGKSAEQRRAERRQKASLDRFPIPFCEFRVQMRSL